MEWYFLNDEIKKWQHRFHGQGKFSSKTKTKILRGSIASNPVPHLTKVKYFLAERKLFQMKTQVYTKQWGTQERKGM